MDRPLTERERLVLDALLAVEFAGAEALREEARTARVIGGCGCGCPSIDFYAETGAGFEPRVDARVQDSDDGIFLSQPDGCATKCCTRFRAMEFTRDELVWINNALSNVLGGPQAIEEWEFHSLIGGTQEEVRTLLGKVSDQVGELRRADPEW